MSALRSNGGGSRAIAGLAAAVTAALPSTVWACPMCFSGNGTNQTAFLYGSLFLMIVPVTSIGGLVYWAHRRAKALDTPAACAPTEAVLAPAPLKVEPRTDPA